MNRPLCGTTEAFGHVYILVFGLRECVHIGVSICVLELINI